MPDESVSEACVHSLLSQSEEGRSVLQLLVNPTKRIGSPVVTHLEAPSAATSELTKNSIFANSPSGGISLVNDHKLATETQHSTSGGISLSKNDE